MLKVQGLWSALYYSQDAQARHQSLGVLLNTARCSTPNYSKESVDDFIFLSSLGDNSHSDIIHENLSILSQG